VHADDLDLGAHGLDVVGHAADQTAAANRHEHRIQARAAQLLQLAQHFHGDGALAGDHVRIVKRVHKGQAFGLLQLDGVLVGVGVAVAGQHHLAAQGLDGIDLDLGCGRGHHDHRAAAQLLGPQGHALGVVAGRRADHAALQLLGRQVGHLVVGAPQLEAEHGLLVLALQQHLVVQAAAEVLGGLQVRLHGHVVDTGRQDLGQVVKGGEVLGSGHMRQTRSGAGMSAGPFQGGPS